MPTLKDVQRLRGCIIVLRQPLALLLLRLVFLLASGVEGFAPFPNVPAAGKQSLSALQPLTNEHEAHVLQRIGNALGSGADLGDIERLLMEVDRTTFPQADAWSKAWTPMRCTIAEADDSWSMTTLVLPRAAKLEWQRHDRAESLSRPLFGNFLVSEVEIQGSDSSRRLEQRELEATYTDAWAVGGSEDSDCVCRGGRCPRMWDCPFWVDRRRAEAKGSSAHVAIRSSAEASTTGVRRAGPTTVRYLEALEPSAFLEIRVGAKNRRFYREITSRVEGAAELIEVLAPLGVKPGIGRYQGPQVFTPSDNTLDA